MQDRSDLAAGGRRVIGTVGTVAGNAEGLGVVGTVVGLGGGVAVVGYAYAGLGKEGGREDMIVVDAGGVGGGDAGSFKSTAGGTAEKCAIGRGLEGIHVLVAEAIAEVAFLGDGVVGLDVVTGEVLVEAEVFRQVVGNSTGQVCGGGEVNRRVASDRVDILKDGEGCLADAGVRKRDLVVGEGSASAAAEAIRRGAKAVGRVTCGGIICLPLVLGEVEGVVGDVVERDCGKVVSLLMIGDAQEVAEDEEPVLENGCPE